MAARNDIHTPLPHADALATQSEGLHQPANVGPQAPAALHDRDVPARPGVEAPTPPAAPASFDDGAQNSDAPPGVEVPKKSRADWTLPPHLRESFPWQPKGGRAPRPTTNTPS